MLYKPSTFQINLNHTCNLHCKHCYGLHDCSQMDEETLSKVLQHIVNIGKLNESITVSFSGGELGLADPKMVINAIEYLKSNLPETRLNFECQTNLMYDISKEQHEMFRLMNTIGTSYDFGNVRFKDTDQRIKWIDNAKFIAQVYGVNKLQIIICITTKLTKYIEPEELIDMLYMMPFKNYELERLCIPMNYKCDINNIKPYWEEVDNYLTRAFIRYLDYRPRINIQMFECMIDSFNGKYWYEHSRTCQQEFLTFSPNGLISGCAFMEHQPFAKVDDSTTDIIRAKGRIANIELEQDTSSCKRCKYFKYCKGDCCRMEWDMEDDWGFFRCPTPKGIYDYLERNNGLVKV